MVTTYLVVVAGLVALTALLLRVWAVLGVR